MASDSSPDGLNDAVAPSVEAPSAEASSAEAPSAGRASSRRPSRSAAGPEGEEDEPSLDDRPARTRSRRGRAGAARPAGAEPAAGEPATGEPTVGETPARRRARALPRTDAAPTDAAPDGDGPAGEAEGTEDGGEPGVRTGTRRRRRRGGRGRSRRPSQPEDGRPDEGEVEPAPVVLEREEVDGARAETEDGQDGGAGEGGTTRRRRRRRSPGAGAAEAGAESADSSAAPEAVAAVATAAPEADGAQPEPAPRRRRSRRGGKEETADAETKTPAAPKARTRTRTRSRAGAATAEPAEEKGAAEPSERLPAPTRTRRTRLPGRRRVREPIATVQGAEDKTMLITEIGDRDQIAVLEDRTLVEHYITRSGARSMVGNIYLGKVQNVLPGMEAAFIDIGRGRNAVLYAGEVSYDEEIEGEAPRIEHVLRSGQNVMVQVTKDPMGGKGARLTQEISLPGRFVVFVPNSQVFGISRRLPDRERQRLKSILREVKPAEHGLIVRTAAVGADADDLRADLERLKGEWTQIAKSAKRGRAPRGLYEEPELTVRVVRDLFTGGEFKEIVTDSPELYAKVRDYLQLVAPELVPKVRMHEGALPILEAFHVVEQIHKALDRKVWLPSGGYIVIDRTEAMTVVDVNTGKHVGKANLEETVTKTNVEAAKEIARQLRLRDIGGIIIVDFIDMAFERNRQKVIDAMRNEMALDKTRSQVFDIGPLGLLEVTRKRVSQGLLEAFSETCPTCEGRGILLTHKL